MRRYVGLLGGLHVGGRVHKRVLLVTEVSLGSAVIRIALGVGSGDGVRDEVARGGVRGRFENIIKKDKQTEIAGGMLLQMRYRGEQDINEKQWLVRLQAEHREHIARWE